MKPTRAAKPNQQERAQRRAVIDTLLGRALRGVLTIPEAALLADYVRAEQRLADTTRRALADTTRALQRHREAADAAVLEAEQRAEGVVARIAGLADEHPVAIDTALIHAALDEPKESSTT